MNSAELSNERDCESPNMVPEVEILSIASQSAPSVEEEVGLAMSSLEAPQGLIGSAHHCL